MNTENILKIYNGDIVKDYGVSPLVGNPSGKQ